MGASDVPSATPPRCRSPYLAPSQHDDFEQLVVFSLPRIASRVSGARDRQSPPSTSTIPTDNFAIIGTVSCVTVTIYHNMPPGWTHKFHLQREQHRSRLLPRM
jgi:hypothetical protein